MKKAILSGCAVFMIVLSYGASQAFDSEGYVRQVLQDYEQSTITSYDTEIIRDWIGWKNDYPRYDQQFQPISNKFHPERKNYREGILMMNFLFYYICATLCTFNIVFLVCRYKCKRCGGKDEFVQKIGTWNSLFTHIFLIGGGIVVIIGCILVAFGTAQFKNAVDDGNSKMKAEKNDLESDFNQINNSMFTVNSYIHADYQAATGQQFSVNLRNSASLQLEINEIKTNADLFVTTSDELEYGRNVWVWLHFLGCMCVLITIICGFILTKSRSWIILAIFCFFYSWELFLLISYNTSEYFILVDICERMYQIVYQYQIPVKGESLAKYLSCLSPSSTEKLVQDIHIVNQGRNTALEYTNKKARELGYLRDPITTQPQLASLLQEPPFSTNDDLVNWNASLMRLDAALQAQNKLRICKQLIAFSAKALTLTCVKGFDAMPQCFTGLCMWVAGSLLLVVGGIKKEIIQKKINLEVLMKATKEAEDEGESESETDSQETVKNKLGEIETLDFNGKGSKYEQ